MKTPCAKRVTCRFVNVSEKNLTRNQSKLAKAASNAIASNVPMPTWTVEHSSNTRRCRHLAYETENFCTVCRVRAVPDFGSRLRLQPKFGYFLKSGRNPTSANISAVFPDSTEFGGKCCYVTTCLGWYLWSRLRRFTTFGRYTNLFYYYYYYFFNSGEFIQVIHWSVL